MKRLLCLMMILTLCCGMMSARAEGSRYCVYCGTENPSYAVYCKHCGARLEEDEQGGTSGGIWLTARVTLAARSGPGTDYSEPGGLGQAGERYLVISRSGIWVQVELYYNGSPTRIYTGGEKRFDVTQAELSCLPAEQVLYTGRLNRSTGVRTGPGTEYLPLHDGLLSHQQDSFLLEACTRVTVYAVENGWAQIDFYKNGTHYRGWVPQKYVSR